MSDAAERHRRQVESWNGPMGQQWAMNEARTERGLIPLTEALLAAAAAQPGEHVLDIGCGCGGYTLALARATGPTGRVIGADVSTAVLEVAEATKAENTDYVLADASTHDFAGTAADLLTSRFGVMFFGDPDAAFANLHRALKPSGRLVFACWRAVADNPWARIPQQAIFSVIDRPPPPHPEEPGPFAFGDAARIHRILAAGGFKDPKIMPFDFEMLFPADPATAAAAISTGPIGGRLLRDRPDAIRAAAVAAIAEAITPCVSNGFTRLGASVWIVIARA